MRMKKLYTLIIITLFPLLTFSQLSNLPDSETGLSIDELKDMRRSNVETKELISKSELVRVKKETNDPQMVRTLTPKTKQTTFKFSNLEAIREEDCDEDK